MRAQLFGIEHILYIIITSIILGGGLLLPDTKLTAWVMAPMYATAYATILIVIELVKNKEKKESNLIYEKM